MAGFYAATFAFLLITRLLVFAATVGVIVLYFLGIISSQNDIGAAPSLFLEWARSSVTAFYAVGSIGALAALTVVTRTVVAGPEASSSRRAIRTGAVAVGVAVLAAGVDWRYGVTPLVERLAPRADFAEAQRSVTCPLTVAEIAEGGSRANGCVTEVEGVLVYADGPRRLELHPEGAGTPSISVYFFLGDRTLFGATAPRLPPSYYDHVSEFVGKRVRIVGTTAPGQVRSGHRAHRSRGRAASPRSMTGSGATPALRIGAAALAAACGLVVGVTIAAALGTVKVLLSPGLEIASTPRALIVGPIMTMAEGMFWGVIGGAMFVFPPAVLALAVFQPRNTRTAALAMSALLFFPIVFIGFRTRWIDALLLALPIWLGVRVALRVFSTTLRT